MASYRISSWVSCLENPLSTIAMMTFSVAMKGSSRSIRCLMTALFTTRPEATLLSYLRISTSARSQCHARQLTRIKQASAQRNDSGRVIRLMAESSRLRSSHCDLYVCSAAPLMLERFLPSEQSRSDLIGLRL